MNSSVIVFPGSNCDRDIAVALEKMQFKNQMVWHKETKLPKSDLIVVPGGFSYGDYLRSGAIAGKSLIINEVIKAANEGCLILGICNGFQILTETGLLKGAVSLANRSRQFKNAQGVLLTDDTISAATKLTGLDRGSDAFKMYMQGKGFTAVAPTGHQATMEFAARAIIEELLTFLK